MSTTCPKTSTLPIKMEDSLLEDNPRDPPNFAAHTPRKRVRSDSFDTGMGNTEPVSGRVKEQDNGDNSGIFLPMSPHTHGDYESLRLLLIEERRMNEGLMEQNNSLLDDLRRTRRELNNLRSRVNFVGRKLQEEAARRSHGSDSSASEENKSDSDSSS
ncbi:hypothetical protein B0H13DRAFT_1864712 [Mycena leptocephala]|nr:hypothetical protein B0H13DRAFT_1864712 [Mycena leptocephala]